MKKFCHNTIRAASLGGITELCATRLGSSEGTASCPQHLAGPRGFRSGQAKAPLNGFLHALFGFLKCRTEVAVAIFDSCFAFVLSKKLAEAISKFSENAPPKADSRNLTYNQMTSPIAATVSANTTARQVLGAGRPALREYAKPKFSDNNIGIESGNDLAKYAVKRRMRA